MLKNLAKLTSGLVISLALASGVYAAVNIRLGQPKSPTNQNSFNINFVTLDTGGGTITVKCLKKGPSDGGFSQFGADIVITPDGGNTGNCSVNSSIINTDGTYQFQATANGTPSNIVAVDFNNTTGPGTPNNYSKEQLSSCVWRVKFKTADDGGKTVKVEVYRSDQTSFNADSSTRVATVSIGSNTDGSADVTNPDCTKTYYFALRAFDTFGDGSGVVGDSVTITTNPATTASSSPTSGGAIAVAGGASQLRAGGAVLGQKTQTNGQVEATATAISTPSAQTSPSPQPEKQDSTLFSIRNVGLGAGILAVLFLIYYFLIRKKPQPPVNPPSQPPVSL